MCSGQWLPCAWRDRQAGGGVVPHPDPSFPSNLGVQAPAAVRGGRPLGCAPACGPGTPSASPAIPERHRRRPAAQLRWRPPRAPKARSPRPAPSPYANVRARQPIVRLAGPALPRQSQWAGGGCGRHAHRRAAPCGRGRRVPFRTSASGRGRHLPGGAWGASLPARGRLPRGSGRVVRPGALFPRPPRGGRILLGNPRDSAHVAGSGPRRGLSLGTRVEPAPPAPTPGCLAGGAERGGSFGSAWFAPQPRGPAPGALDPSRGICHHGRFAVRAGAPERGCRVLAGLLPALPGPVRELKRRVKQGNGLFQPRSY